MFTRRYFLSTMIFGFSLFGSCFAQTDASPSWTGFTSTKVKPEKRQEFERYLKQLIAAHKNAGIDWFVTLETFAGDTTEYTTVAPIIKFADLDGPPVVTKVLGEAGWARLSRKMARCYTAQSHEYATPHTELEINHTNGPIGIYWVETRILLAPGKMGEYLNWIRNDYRPALQKAGVMCFHVSQPIFGAAAGEIVTMRMLKNLGEIDEGSVLSKALTDEEARAIAAKSVPLVAASKTRIVRMRNDLSYGLLGSTARRSEFKHGSLTD